MYNVKILADSINPEKSRLTTMEIRYPRIILAEFNTHRQFSRNTASSRAIPVAKMIEAVENSECPIKFWGRNKPGMQAEELLTGYDYLEAQNLWAEAKENALQSARKLNAIGAHKQIVNRLLEPFMWITTVVSATHWDNFFKLRCHSAAQPEMKILADMMQDAYNESVPLMKEVHLPYIDDAGIPAEQAMKISAARCARVSYKSNETGNPSTFEEDLALCERLLSSGHLSPFEHVARLRKDEWFNDSNFHPTWVQMRKLLE